jgi:TonB-linked SusC/RagA family outer membrane protein
MLVIAPLGMTAYAQQGAIAGTVMDSTSNASLPGANVQLVGTERGAATDADGNYTITGISPGSYDVRFSFVGFEPQVIEDVQVRANETTQVDVMLLPSALEADEVVVVGYGTTQRSDLTGSVVSIDEAELTEVPGTNVMESLQGEVPGMDITQTSGETGAGLNFTVRGNRSLTASNQPLFIVDGVQYSSIANLNPNDIESIEVLKDAASTAIYGARGANGVVLITTKKGTSEGTRVNVSTYAGVTQSTGYPAHNNAEQYIQQRREAHRTTGEWSGPEDDDVIFSPPELEAIENGTYTNWSELFIEPGLQHSHQVGVSTGSETTNAYLSLGYFSESGIVEMDHLTRYSLRVNLSHEINDVIQVGTNTQATFTDQDQRSNPLNLANKISPIRRALDSDGEIIPFPTSADINPLLDEEPNHYENNTKVTDLSPTVFVELTPLETLTFRSDVSYGLDYSRQGIYRAALTVDRNGASPEARYLTSNSRGLDLENVLTYDDDFGEHSVTLTGVFSYLQNRNDFGSELGQGQLLNSQLFYGLRNAPEGISIDTGYEESSLLSYAGRLQYGWQGKYLLNLTARADGSSRLSEDNKWAVFPSVSAAWRIADEPFMEDQSLFDELKLRASYGVSGNDAVAPYATQASLIRIPWGWGEEAAPGYAFSEQLGNTNLEWEISRTANLGVDMGFWGGRVSATIDVYNTNTSNLLLQRFLPETSGASNIVQNVGETRNRGVELSLNSRNVVTNDFFWESSLTFFSNDEEIVSLTGEGDDVANGWFIGEPTEVFYDYEKIGIWQQDEAQEAASFGQEPGEIKVRDQNGDGEITPEDRVILGSPRPDWSGSIENSFNYKGFDLSALVFVRWGQMMRYDYYGNYKPSSQENGAAVDYWTPDNPTNAFPRPNSQLSDENYPFFESLTYEDASFVKLRSLTLGYNLPENILDGLNLENVRIYLRGRNLWTISGVEDYDPERGGGLSFPMTRAFVGGVDISL